MVGNISISGVSKHFINPTGERITALDNVSLDIPAGSFVSLIGTVRLRQVHAAAFDLRSDSDGRRQRRWTAHYQGPRCRPRLHVSGAHAVSVAVDLR